MSHRLVTVAAGLVLAGTAWSCSRHASTAERYLESGDRYAARGQYAEAIVEYRNAVARDPRSPARVRLADAYEATGDLAAAYAEYVRAGDLPTAGVPLQIKIGYYHLVAGRFDEARALAERLLASRPNHVESQILFGYALAGLRDTSGAVAALRGATRLIGDADEAGSAGINLGALEMATGDARAAESTLQRVSASNPRSVPARLALANLCWATGRLAEAETHLVAAIRIDPRDARANRAIAMFYVATHRAPDAEPYLVAFASGADAAGRLLLADFYQSQGRIWQAREVLERLAADPAMFAEAELRLAITDRKVGRPAAGAERVARVLSVQPAHVMAIVVGAQFLLADRRLDEAIAEARRAQAIAPDSALVHYVLGVGLAAAHRYAEAVASLTEAARLDPLAVDAQYELSRLYLATGKPESAREFAQQVLHARPGHIGARLLLVRSLSESDDLAGARAQLEPLVAIAADDARVQVAAGRLALREGRFEAARSALERAAVIDGRSIDAVAGLAAVDLASGKPDAARARVETAVRRNVGDASRQLLAARTLAAVGDVAGAETALRRSLDLDPSQIDPYSLLGELYLSRGRVTEALAEFERLAARQPDSVAAHTMVATLLHAQNRLAEARARYEVVLQIDPRAPVAANNLAWMTAEAGGNLDVALQLAQAAKAALPDAAEVDDTLGWIYCKKGLATLAIGPLTRSVERDPRNPIALYHLGLAYAKLGDRLHARRTLEQALSIRPDFEGSADARQILSSLGE